MRKTRGPSTELLDEMRADADAPVPEDKLEAIVAKMRELRDIEMEIAEDELYLSKMRERRRQILDKELVDALDEVHLRDMTLEAEGNMPPLKVSVGPYYHANIAADWPVERRKKAFAWIDKYHPGMLRNTFTVSFGKESRRKQKALESFCKKQRLDYSFEFGVPWNTLTSFVREQIEEMERTPPLELLGATVGRVARIIKQKEK